MTNDDLDRVLEWRNHPDVAKQMLRTETISADEHLTWFNHCQTTQDRHLLIFERNGPSGFVQFNSIPGSDVAEWGFYVAPGAPKGTGTQLGITALNHAFNSLCLHKVFGQVLSSNTRSIYLHKRLGFSPEGILREHQLRDQEHFDIHCYGLLHDEWPTDVEPPSS